MSPTLRACPFCGSYRVSVHDISSLKHMFFAVSCVTCEAEGPVSRTEERATAAWNTRRKPSGDGDGRGH